MGFTDDLRFSLHNNDCDRMLKKCITLNNVREGKRIHAHLIKTGLGLCIFLVNRLVEMYAKCDNLLDARNVFDRMPMRNVFSWNTMIAGYFKWGSIDHARQLFENMPERDDVSWNTMITGYDRNGYSQEALECYWEMMAEGIVPSAITFSSVLSSCAKLPAPKQGKQVHAHIIGVKCQSDMIVGVGLVDMYAKGGCIEDARLVFDRMTERNVVSWNAMITGYGENGLGEEALMFFYEMQQLGMKPDQVTIIIILTACFKSGKVQDACNVFDEIPERNVSSWNAMIAGYVQNGDSEQAMQLFLQMLQDVRPDETTFASVVTACASLAALQQGKQVHGLVTRSGLESSVFVGSALVDVYSKCGSTEHAQQVFDNLLERNLVCWNTMITGYAQNGQGQLAIQLFEEMLKTGIVPNHVTYVSVLSACSHTGLLDEGLRYFNLMSEKHRILPRASHYTCMIDLLGRAGRLDEAEKLVKNAPFDSNAAMWLALLSACRLHGNLELAERASKCLFEMEPQISGPYVLMSNIYAAAGRWVGVANIRKLMRDRGVKKEPGCSWIEIKNTIHNFLD
ncbi:pentatricopeptide repeat-containing protein At2g13600 [Cryptomeria japonica]|uniref:pentatricopeptide repeat-containing protein At2g13600 n=1 Tax=Cryptomeria japonica TaxID=3369 RepID=UPI0027DAB030|nr:pentatricopeptide repeat-containing protein At2g13600 [Cryptomeria japonica]